MLKISRFDGVTRIDSARTIAKRGYYWTTAYLVEGLLIDTGCAYSAADLFDAMKGENLEYIINTHSHEDHIGANGILQQQRQPLEVLAHPLALPVLAKPRENQPLQLYRRLLWGWPEPSEGRAVQDGEEVQTRHHCFQMIFTPGHSPDHICLYEQEQGWLFTGDLFVGGRDRALRVDYNIWQIIASLKRVAQLPVQRLFPGCARMRDNPGQELSAKIMYMEETGERILALRQRGMDPRTIARAVFGGAMLIELITLGHFTRRNLVESYLTNERHS